MLEVSGAIECSVVVCTYRPNWEKLHLTLKSILMQEKCKIQIIVTDDGSEDNLFDKIREYLDSHHFANYKLIASPKNKGTVYNVWQGVVASKGLLVKPISPGDFLHGKGCLRQWIDFMNAHEDYVMSYCDSIYYHWDEKEIIPVKTKANPQSREPSVQQYIMYGDFCLGASAMVRRQKWLKYLEMMREKVVYCEDFSYQIMLLQGKKIINIPRPLLLYEFGTGISTCKSSFWNERLKNDMEAIRQILLSLDKGHDKKTIMVNKYLHIPLDNSLRSKWKRIMICPSKIIFRFKTVFFPRLTSVKLDKDYLRDLLT